MCRNITILRGLEPPATGEEIEAAARQFVRKVTGITAPSAVTRDPFEDAVTEVSDAVTRLLAALPERRRPPASVPPLRRPHHHGDTDQPSAHPHDHDHPHEPGHAVEHQHAFEAARD